MWTLYQLAFALALLVAGPFLLVRRGRHYLGTVSGRLGGYDGPVPDSPVWLHAVSVGEVGVAATLVDALAGDPPLVVTTVTPTGQGRARTLFAGRGAVAYLPYDLGFAVRRFLDRFSPRALVLVEGDLWPLVLARVKRRDLPVVVVNGRVSDRSFRRMARFRRLIGPLVAPVDRWGVQTEADRRRLLALGVPAERVEVTGNLKFESAAPPRRPSLEALLLAAAAGRPILVAGSTMRGEEEAVLDAFELAGGGGRALLVLAPRHPERWGEVDALIARRGLARVRRTQLGPATGASGPPGTERPDTAAPPAVVLLDSLGELAALYRLGAGAFIGGTLVPTGGHNPLEAARFGVPVAVGPSMENFLEIADEFRRREAWRQVDDARGLAAAWRGWLEHPEEAAELGGRGRALVESNRGALARTLETLAPWLPPPAGPAAVEVGG